MFVYRKKKKKKKLEIMPETIGNVYLNIPLKNISM